MEYFFIEVTFKPSRKSSFEEDSFTYLRNEIAHSEDTNDYNLYSKLGNDISNNTIKELIIILNDVILELK